MPSDATIASGRLSPAARISGRVRPVRGNLLLLLAAAALTLAGAVAGTLTVRGGEPPPQPPSVPVETSVAELRALAADADAPIFWAGTAPGTRFEVTETGAGKVFVRYLPPNVEVGDKRPAFLTVGTYPYGRAYAVTAERSHQKGMARAEAPAGGLAVWSEKRPSSVYVAYPGADYLVEVFSPEASEARRLV